MKRLTVEGGTMSAKLEGSDPSVPEVVAAQLGKRDGLERAMHDETGVSLDLIGVGTIVVNSMGIVGQGGEAKQHH
jgi:hypothetical protein